MDTDSHKNDESFGDWKYHEYYEDIHRGLPERLDFGDTDNIDDCKK